MPRFKGGNPVILAGQVRRRRAKTGLHRLLDRPHTRTMTTKNMIISINSLPRVGATAENFDVLTVAKQQPA